MERGSGVDIRWRTISYRTVTVLVVLALGGLGFVIYLLAPNLVPNTINTVQSWFEGHPLGGDSTAPLGARQARFLNIEGAVLVKKDGAALFTPATLDTLLDHGDTVQTQDKGWARLAFGDNTTYLLKPSSLIVIEQNTVAANGSSIAVNVNAGVVDLSTGHTEGKKNVSRIHFADADASLNDDTRAQLDTSSQTPSLTLLAGSAHVQRGNESVQVHAFERLNVTAGHPLGVEAVARSPHLLTPGNLSPVLVSEPSRAVVTFTWAPSGISQPGTIYHLRVSRSPFFSSTMAEIPTAEHSAVVGGLATGSYYWTVTALDAKGHESPALGTYKFILQKAAPRSELTVTIDHVVQIGRSLEVFGHSAPGAKVLVNDEVVGLMNSDGSFKHVTAAYPHEGEYTLSVTAEDSIGRVATKTKSVTIQ